VYEIRQTPLLLPGGSCCEPLTGSSRNLAVTYNWATYTTSSGY